MFQKEETLWICSHCSAVILSPANKSLINEFEASVNHTQTSVDICHHKEQPGVQKAFQQDEKSLKSSFNEFGNPFSESTSDLLVLDTRDVAKQLFFYKIEALGSIPL